MPLTIKRRLGERILIGPNVEITLIGITGNSVALYVKAPEYLQINRPGKDQDAIDRAVYADLKAKEMGGR